MVSHGLDLLPPWLRKPPGGDGPHRWGRPALSSALLPLLLSARLPRWNTRRTARGYICDRNRDRDDHTGCHGDGHLMVERCWKTIWRDGERICVNPILLIRLYKVYTRFIQVAACVSTSRHDPWGPEKSCRAPLHAARSMHWFDQVRLLTSKASCSCRGIPELKTCFRQSYWLVRGKFPLKQSEPSSTTP